MRPKALCLQMHSFHCNGRKCHHTVDPGRTESTLVLVNPSHFGVDPPRWGRPRPDWGLPHGRTFLKNCNSSVGKVPDLAGPIALEPGRSDSAVAAAAQRPSSVANRGGSVDYIYIRPQIVELRTMCVSGIGTQEFRRPAWPSHAREEASKSVRRPRPCGAPPRPAQPLRPDVP